MVSFLKANQSWKNNFGPKLFKKWKKQWLNINGKNAFEYSLRLGLYLKVECMNQSETNFSITAEFQQLWQGAISHVWTSQFDKHWQHSQKQLQKYDIRDKNRF